MTVTLQRGDTTVILKGVPAEVCDNCGEYYLSEDVTRRIMDRAEAAVRSGAEVKSKCKRSRLTPKTTISAFPSPEEAAAATQTPFESFASQPELAELAKAWPAERLV